MYDKELARSISDAVNSYLAGNDMTGGELAEKAGLHPNTITLCRCGKGLPSLYTAYKLARAMDITIDKLTGIDNKGERI